ncbi:hypothetical protein ACA910_013728 [Epithemia clementina (nom. ined.)]
MSFRSVQPNVSALPAAGDLQSRLSGLNQSRGSPYRHDRQLGRQLVPTAVADYRSQIAASAALPSHVNPLACRRLLREQLLQALNIQALQEQESGRSSNDQPSWSSLANNGPDVFLQPAGLYHQERQQQEGYFQRIIGQYDVMSADQEHPFDTLLHSRVELVRSILERTSEQQHQSHTPPSRMSISRSNGLEPTPHVQDSSVSQTRTPSVLESYPAAAIGALCRSFPYNTLGSYNSLAETLRISRSSTDMAPAGIIRGEARQEMVAWPFYGFRQLSGTQYTNSLSSAINSRHNETSPPTNLIRTMITVPASTTAPGTLHQGTSSSSFSLPGFPLNEQLLVESNNSPGQGATTGSLIESSSGDLIAVSVAAGADATTALSAQDETVLQQSLVATRVKEGHTEERKQKKRKYDHESFPQKLHRLITNVERQGPVGIISFVDEGGFRVDKQQAFVDEIMGDYFRGNTWSSFRRQLFSYNFPIQKAGRNKGAFLNPQFIMGRPELCKLIERDGRYDRTKNRKKGALI